MVQVVEEAFAKLCGNFKENKMIELRELSNSAIEKAAVIQDKTVVDISLIAYALSKLMGKPHFVKSDKWPNFQKHILDELERKEKTSVILEEIIKDVTAFDRSLGNYVGDLIEQARIKQASRIYALGLSLSKACELCSVDKSSLLQYIGKTRIHDRPYTKSKDVARRFEIAKKIFG
jgi:hypothetical protein